MDFGVAIRNLRLTQGMTQKQLAERCQVSINTVSSWETGNSQPPKSAIGRICKAFGIPTALLPLSAIEEDDLPEEKKILYRTLIVPLRDELTNRECESEHEQENK